MWMDAECCTVCVCVSSWWKWQAVVSRSHAAFGNFSISTVQHSTAVCISHFFFVLFHWFHCAAACGAVHNVWRSRDECVTKMENSFGIGMKCFWFCLLILVLPQWMQSCGWRTWSAGDAAPNAHTHQLLMVCFVPCKCRAFICECVIHLQHCAAVRVHSINVCILGDYWLSGTRRVSRGSEIVIEFSAPGQSELIKQIYRSISHEINFWFTDIID